MVKTLTKTLFYLPRYITRLRSATARLTGSKCVCVCVCVCIYIYIYIYIHLYTRIYKSLYTYQCYHLAMYRKVLHGRTTGTLWQWLTASAKREMCSIVEPVYTWLCVYIGHILYSDNTLELKVYWAHCRHRNNTRENNLGFSVCE